jgi:hypothetical protein
MYELLIAETKELEKYLRGKVIEGEGSRVDEVANIYFGYSDSLEREIVAGRLPSEATARLRYTSALCAARKAADIVRSHKECRADLARVFARYRQKRLAISCNPSCPQ